MASAINIKNIPSGYQSIITNGKHTVIGDEPIKSGGTDLGLKPTEFILAGLALCKAATIRHHARKEGWTIGEIDATMSQKVRKNSAGKFVTQVFTEISIEGDISDTQREILIKKADDCYVQRLLEDEWNIEHAIEKAEPVFSI